MSTDPIPLRVTISSDAARTPTYEALWRRLLAPVPAGDLAPLAEALDGALTRAEPDAAVGGAGDGLCNVLHRPEGGDHDEAP